MTTHGTLMALHDDSASAVYARDMDAHREARAALSAALTKLIAERDANASWKRAAEYWYGEYRHLRSGDQGYPVDGALDSWFENTWKSIQMKGTPT